MKVLWLGQQELTEELLESTVGSWHRWRYGVRDSPWNKEFIKNSRVSTRPWEEGEPRDGRSSRRSASRFLSKQEQLCLQTHPCLPRI